MIKNDLIPIKGEKISLRNVVLQKDIAGVREVVLSTGFFTLKESKIAVELIQERLEKGFESEYFFLFAENNKELIGYTCFGLIPCTESSYDLYWIVVHNRYRRKGIGSLLIVNTEKMIEKMGGNRIYIDTSSTGKYTPTRAFYMHSGYKETAVLKDFYHRGDDKIIYCKII